MIISKILLENYIVFYSFENLHNVFAHKTKPTLFLKLILNNININILMMIIKSLKFYN